jgi:hypothetical protein
MSEKTVPVHARIAESTRDIAKAHARRLHISDAAYYRLAIETLNGVQSAKVRVEGPEIVPASGWHPADMQCGGPFQGRPHMHIYKDGKTMLPEMDD